jgi:hypothetical protein
MRAERVALNGGLLMRSLYNSTLSLVLALGFFSVPAGAVPVGTPLGVVVLANGSRVGGSVAVNGSTVFQGDRLATSDGGRLQVRFGSRQAQLSPTSLAVVTENSSVLNAELLNGTISLSSAAGEMFAVSANAATVRPAGSGNTIAQVTRVSPSELLLSSRKGTLQVTFESESTIIPEGSSYRMIMDPVPAQYPQGAGSSGSQQSSNQLPQAAAKNKSRKRAAFILLGAAGAAAGIAIAAVGGSSSPVVSPSAP